MSVRLEQAAEKFTTSLVILDDQKVERNQRWRRARGLAVQLRTPFQWKMECNGSAFTRRRHNGDSASMSTNDPVHFGQTKSRTCCALCGEKWLEGAFSYLGTHARSIVLDDDHRFIAADLGPHREGSVRGHRIHRIRHQIEQRLANLARYPSCPHLRRVIANHANLDSAGSKTLSHRLRQFQDLFREYRKVEHLV